MLRSAANYLGEGENKWAKGDFHVDDGSCALGVIEHVMDGSVMITWEFDEAEAALLKNLKDMHPELAADTIPDLNDDPAVTYEDVLTAFEKTALQFEEQGR